MAYSRPKFFCRKRRTANEDDLRVFTVGIVTTVIIMYIAPIIDKKVRVTEPVHLINTTTTPNK